MAKTTRPDPSELWMPMFGIETDVARAAQLRKMLEAVPWELADQLYGSREAMQARVARMTAELEALQRRIEEEGEAAPRAPRDIDTRRRTQAAGGCLQQHTEPSIIFAPVNMCRPRCKSGGGDEGDGPLLG